MHTTEHDHLGFGSGRPLREPKRIAYIVGDIVDLGQLVVVREDDSAPLLCERAHLLLERRDVLQHERCIGRAYYRKVHGSDGSRMRERSKAGAL